MILTKMEIQNHPSCSNDYLEIQDVENEISVRLCGSLESYTKTASGSLCIRTNSSRVLVVFSSDATIAFSGFELQFESSDHYDTNDYACDQYYSMKEIATLFNLTGTYLGIEHSLGYSQ